MDIASLNLFAGWVGTLGGVISGAVIGLFFHQEGWLQGYSSFPRRMARLGHISFWGLGFLNMMFAFSVRFAELSGIHAQVASVGFIVGLVTMPLCCFVTAWWKVFRFLFPIPVLSVLIGAISLLIGWAAK